MGYGLVSNLASSSRNKRMDYSTSRSWLTLVVNGNSKRRLISLRNYYWLIPLRNYYWLISLRNYYWSWWSWNELTSRCSYVGRATLAIRTRSLSRKGAIFYVLTLFQEAGQLQQTDSTGARERFATEKDYLFRRALPISLSFHAEPTVAYFKLFPCRTYCSVL